MVLKDPREKLMIDERNKTLWYFMIMFIQEIIAW